MVQGVLHLHAVEGFAVGLVGLAADVVGDAGHRHQVALVGGVEEHLAAVDFARFHRHRNETWAVLADAVLAVQPPVEDDGNFVLAEKVVEDVLGDVRLEGPGGVLAAIVARSLEVGALLVFPARLVLIVSADAAVEVAGDAADGSLVADVGGAEAAGGHAAQVLARLDQHDGLAHAGGLDRRRDAARRAAVDDQIIRVFGRTAGGRRDRTRSSSADETRRFGMGFSLAGAGLRNHRPLIVAPPSPNARRETSGSRFRRDAPRSAGSLPRSTAKRISDGHRMPAPKPSERLSSRPATWLDAGLPWDARPDPCVR